MLKIAPSKPRSASDADHKRSRGAFSVPAPPHHGPNQLTDFAAFTALCTIARLHQVAADPATLAHQLGLAPADAVSTDDLLRAAQHLGLKAKLSRSSVDRLALTPLPALACCSIPSR